MNAGIVSQIVSILFNAVNVFATIIIAPISALIHDLFPIIDTGLATISQWMYQIMSYVGWILNAFAIPGIVILIVVSYYIFIVSSSLAAYSVKFVLRWYNILKP